MRVKAEAAVLAAACAVCCAPLVAAAAPVIAPVVVAGAVLTAAGRALRRSSNTIGELKPATHQQRQGERVEILGAEVK